MRSKKAIYNILFGLLLEFIMIINGFVVPKIIISSFGSATNGLVSSITQFLAYITLLESGVGNVVKATLYKPIANKDKEKIKKILKNSEKFFQKIAIIFVVYIIVLIFIYPRFFNTEFDIWFTISLIIIISLSTFAEYFFGITYKLFLQAEQKNYISSIIQICIYIVSIVCVIVLAKMHMSIQIIKLVSGIIFTLKPLLQNLYVKKKYNINLKDVDDTYKIKQKWDGLSQHIANVVHNNTDIAVLTIFSTFKEVSVYSVYYMVVKGVKQIIQAFSSGVVATFGDMIAKDEHENLKRKLNLYEDLYFTLITIVFICAMTLIVPFIKVYTLGITDAEYIRVVFGYLIVISEYIWAIRLPYINLTYSAGHFKETRKGAWVEAISNILVSIILVSKLGLIGVAIGTIIAMTIRTIEFLWHSYKYIIKDKVSKVIKKIILLILETILIVLLINKLTLLKNISYINWSINALIIFLITTILVLSFNIIFYRESFKSFIMMIKRIKMSKISNPQN